MWTRPSPLLLILSLRRASVLFSRRFRLFPELSSRDAVKEKEGFSRPFIMILSEEVVRTLSSLVERSSEMRLSWRRGK